MSWPPPTQVEVEKRAPPERKPSLSRDGREDGGRRGGSKGEEEKSAKLAGTCAPLPPPPRYGVGDRPPPGGSSLRGCRAAQ